MVKAICKLYEFRWSSKIDSNAVIAFGNFIRRRTNRSNRFQRQPAEQKSQHCTDADADYGKCKERNLRYLID